MSGYCSENQEEVSFLPCATFDRTKLVRDFTYAEFGNDKRAINKKNSAAHCSNHIRQCVLVCSDRSSIDSVNNIDSQIDFLHCKLGIEM